MNSRKTYPYKIKLKKAIALFLLITLLNQVFAPTVAFALTSGPTAPEATNFEPIDTTDMVNPLTGSFTYSIPMLEVPGPEGGYPLALSYHAGIQPNEEASWVGLGWSLNPGAIARNVNGYPDDWSASSGGGGTILNNWAGGSQSTYSVGVNIGVVGSPASVNFGLSFSSDTYRGFGIGESFGVGNKLGGANSPFGIGVQVGVSPYGNTYAGANISYSAGSLGQTGLKGSASLGLQTNFQSVNASLSGSLSSGSNSVSISTSNIRPSLSIGGSSITSANDPEAGKISTSTNGFFIPIPINPVVSLSLGYQHVRYWSSTTSNFTANGVINNRASIGSFNDLNSSDDDNYSITDANLSFVDNPDPRTQLGGTFPNFDNYSVTGQGIGGNIRPYAFSTVLFNQNKINNNNHSSDIYGESLPYDATPQTLGKKWQFRFINDLSNSYVQTHPWSSDQRYNFDSAPKYGNNDGDYGYDGSTNRLEGTNHIEYFTNAQITNGAAAQRGFIDCDEAGGFVRSDYGVPNQIGGFMITNASGVTYHYALPVYSSGENFYTRSKDGASTNSVVKNTAYAYTWYLTAITGPDYVSRGAAGIISPDDWGYWVKFDYGKWTDNYEWRTPGVGFKTDLDNGFQSSSSGRKQVYYLDAIKTRTHTALFIKDQRADGKSYGPYSGVPTSATGYDSYSVPSLQLSSVLLLKNDQFTSSIAAIRTAGNSTAVNANSTNTIDATDIAQLAEPLVQKSLRRIALTYDNSLCSGVVNSFNPANISNKLGKLTLLSIDFQGMGGASLTPPMEFQYDLDGDDPNNQGNMAITQATDNQPGTNQAGIVQMNTTNKFKAGDILTFQAGGTNYWCTLLSTPDGGNSYQVLFLNNSPGSGAVNTTVAVKRTKNPPFNYDAVDNWGCYKSDYIPSPNQNENLSRLTTSVSNVSTDVWSLRKIRSSLGAEVNVNYEGNTYNRSVLNDNKSLVLTSFTRNSPGNYTISVANESSDISNMYHAGDKINLILLKRVLWNNPGIYVQNAYTALDSKAYPSSAVIQSVTNTNTFTVIFDAKMDADVVNTAGYTWLNTAGQTGTTNQGPDYSAQIVEGNISAKGSGIYYGGGIRVKDVSVDDLSGTIKKTAYDYTMPGKGSAYSSGITAYEPLIFDRSEAFIHYTYVSGGSTFGLYWSDANQVPPQVYKRALYKDANKLLSLARELPAPGITYEYVSVSDYGISPDGVTVPLDGKKTFQYEVFKPEMVGFKDYNDLYGIQPASGSAPVSANNTPTFLNGQAKKDRTIKDYTSRIGLLKRVITYDNLGNKLSEKINHYLHDDLANSSFENQTDNYEPRLAGYNNVAYNNMGVIKERYGNARFLINSYSTQKSTGASFLMMSNKETFPALQTGTTQIDYKNGTRMDQTNLAYDYYTGAVTKTLTTDSYGNRFRNEVTPAYMAGNGAAYPALGLKTHDDAPGATMQHKHMLTQQASNYTFAVDNTNTPLGVVAASAQTWSSSVAVVDPDDNVTTTGQSNIWRLQKSLVWLPAGNAANNLKPYASFVDYFASGGSTNSSWKTVNQISQYNVYSSALEGNDLSNVSSATRMGYKSSKIVMTARPARYNEIAYTGAEDPLLTNGNFSTNVSKGSGTVVIDSTKAHTGLNSLKVGAGLNGFTYTVPVAKLNSSQNYSVAVWVRPAAGSNFNQALLYYTANGTTVTPVQSYTKVAANWCLLEMTVPASALLGTNLVVGCKNASGADMYFDDFRFQPIAASSTAYVYDNKTGELNYMLGINNLFTRYQYDGIGRLVRVYKEVLGKSKVPLIQGISYNYARTSAACPVDAPPSAPTSSTATSSFLTPNPMDQEWKMEAPPGYTLADDDGTTINAGKNAGLNAGRFAYFSTAGTLAPLTYIDGNLSFSAKGSGTIEVQLISTNNNSIQARKTFALTSAFQNFSWAITNLYPQVEMVAAVIVNGGNSSLQASVQFQNNFNLSLNQLAMGASYTRFRADETSMIGNSEKDWYGWSDQYNAPRKKYLQHSAYARMKFQTSATHIAIEYVRDFYDKRIVNLFPVTQVQNNKIFDVNGNVVSGNGAVNTYTKVLGGQVYTISGLLTTNPTIVWFHDGSQLGPPVALTNAASVGMPPVYQVTAPVNATNLGILVQNANDNFKVYSNCMVQQGAIGASTPLDGTIPSAYTAFAGYTPSHISGPAIFINGSLYKYYQVEGNDIAKVIQFVVDDLPAGNKTVEVMMPGQGTYLPEDPHVRRSGTYLRAVYFPGTTTTLNTTPAPGSIVYIHDSILSGFNISSDAQNNVWMMMLQRNPSFGFTGDVFSEGYAGRILNTDVATPELTKAFAAKLASFGVDKYWFQIGVNDFGFNTPLPLFYSQYKSLIEQLKVLRPNAKFYIQSTGPEFFEGANSETIGDDGLSPSGPSANDFRDVQRAIATTHAYCEYVDFENLFAPSIDNLSDGIHPTDAGNLLYANGVKNKSTLLGTVLPVSSLSFYRSTGRHLVQSVQGIYTINATGGKAPYIFSKVSGNLPSGLTFNSDGTITGAPSAAGSYPISVKVTDSNGASLTSPYVILVDMVPSVNVGPLHIINAQTNVFYSQAFRGYFGYGPYSYAVTSGTPPTGMNFNTSTGILSGTTPYVGTSRFTITATDHYGFQGSKEYTLVAGNTTPVGLSDNFTVSGSVDANNHLWLTGHLNDMYSQTLYSFIAAYFTPSGGNEIFLDGKNVNIGVGQRDGTPVDMGAMGLLPGNFSIRMVNGGIAPTSIDGVNISYAGTTTQSLNTTASSPTEQYTVSATINTQGHLILTGHLPNPPSTTIYTAVGAGITQNGTSTYMPAPDNSLNITAGNISTSPVDIGLVPGSSGSVSVRIFIGALSPNSDKGYVITYPATTDFVLTKP